MQQNYLSFFAKLLLLGRSAAATRVHKSASETATHDGYPIAWTWKPPAGSRIFTITIGSPDDLKTLAAQRLIFNAIHWAAGRDVPRE